MLLANFKFFSFLKKPVDTQIIVLLCTKSKKNEKNQQHRFNVKCTENQTIKTQQSQKLKHIRTHESTSRKIRTQNH